MKYKDLLLKYLSSLKIVLDDHVKFISFCRVNLGHASNFWD